MMTEQNELIVLMDENGQEHNFTLLDVIHVNGYDYAILLPVIDGEEEADPVAFRIVEEEDGEGETLLVVEDEEELKAIQEAWEAILDEEFDEAGEDE